MKTDLARLRGYAPLLVPIVLVALGWVALVRPTMARTSRSAGELDALRQRMATIRADSGHTPPENDGRELGDPLVAFQRQVSASDPSGRVMEELSRLASAAGVQVHTIEPAEEEIATFGQGPAVADRAVPDPRLALFDAPLKFSRVTLTAECDYKSLGEFMWRLRDLGALIEIRSLEVTQLVAPNDETGVTPGRLRVSLMMFAYSTDTAERREVAE